MAAPNTPGVTARIALLLRVTQTAIAVGLLGVLCAGLFFWAALFSQRRPFFYAALVALIISLLGRAVTEAFGAWSLSRSGAWAGLDGKRHSRAEQPGGFKARLAIQVLVVAVFAGAACYLTWTLYASWP